MRKTSKPLSRGALSCLLVGLVLLSWMLVNAQSARPVPGRAVDHAPKPAVLSRPCPSAAHRESDDLAWRPTGSRATIHGYGIRRTRAVTATREAGI